MKKIKNWVTILWNLRNYDIAVADDGQLVMTRKFK